MKKKISIIMALALVIELIGCLGANKTDTNAETTNVITQNWQNYSEVWETGQEYMAQNKFSSTNTSIKADIVSTGFATNYDTNVPDDAYSIGGMWGDNPYQIRSTNTVKVVPGNTYKFKFAIKNGMKKSKIEATEKNITVAVNSNIKGDSTTFFMKTITVSAGVSKQYEFDVPISQDYGSNSVQLQFAYGSYLYSYSLTEAVKNGKVSDAVGMNNKYAFAYGTTENASASGTLEFSDITFQGEKYSEIYTTAQEKDEGDYWKSFSVCTREDGGKWEDALKELSLKKGIDYATEGYVTKGSTNDSFEYYVMNSGWDAEYSPIDNSLKDDNPWGMTASKNNISVENGREYTISFKIKSTLKRNDTKNITSKHIRFRMYNPNDESEEIYAESIEGISNGFILLDSNSNQYSSIGANGDGYVTVVIKIHIPLEDYNSDAIAFKFGFGANLLSYPDEIAQKGSIFVKDFKVVPGEMETTEQITTEETTTEETSPETTSPETTSEETTTERKKPITTEVVTKKEGVLKKKIIIAKSIIKAYSKRPFLLKAKATGNERLIYKSNNNKVAKISSLGKVTMKGYGKAIITITAPKSNQYEVATKKIELIVIPKKAKLSKVKSSRKESVDISWKKDNLATGYQVQISTSRKFRKGVLQRYFSSSQKFIKVPLKKKSGKKYYVHIRSYKRMNGIDYYGKWSSLKSVIVK